MCCTCGCNQPDDDHGDDRNIVRSKFQAAADAQGLSLPQVAQNVKDCIGGKSGGQAVDIVRKSFKVRPGTTKVLDEKEGIVEAWVNTTDVEDLQKDIMRGGCWEDVIKAADAGDVDRPATVWGHNWDETTGQVLSAKEYRKGDPAIPEKIAKLGGGALKITCQYNLDTQRGREAFSDVSKGVIRQWSVGFIPDPETITWEKGVRSIGRVEEWLEVSNVLVGASLATGTASSKAANGGSGDDMVDCPTCSGKGKIRGGNVSCPDCDGKGKLTRDAADKLGKSARSAARLEQALELAAACKEAWSGAYIGSLPNSAFAYVEAGCDKKSCRHFPHHDKDGNVDEAHVRNALARIPQSSVSDSAKASALSHIKAHARKLGLEVSDDGKHYRDPGGEWKAVGDVDAYPWGTMTDDEAQHNGPLLQALDGIKTLIAQECAEDGYSEFDDVASLCYVAQSLIRWARGETSEYGMGGAYSLFDLFNAGRAELDRKAHRDLPVLSDEAVNALVHGLNPTIEDRDQRSQHDVPDADGDGLTHYARRMSRPRLSRLLAE